MAYVLDDDRLHEFIGGRPAAVDELRARYHRLVAGPKEPGHIWLNWIARNRHGGDAVGTMQATIVTTANGASTADVAWVIGAA